MRSVFISVLVGVSLGACATTKPSSDLAEIEVRAAKLVDKQEFDAAAMFAKAEKLYAEGKFKSAKAAYNRVLVRAEKDDKNYLDALLGYADSALALGNNGNFFAVAGEAYELLAEDSDLSDDQKNRLLSGQVLLEIAKGDSADAEVRLNEALEQNLDDPRLWNALGQFHDKNEDWLIALETYVKALHVANVEGYPVSPVVNNMGVSLLLQKRTKQALEKFEQAHELNPDIAIYDNNRRLALIMTGRMQKAVEDLTDKRAALVYNDAGYLSAAMGRTGRARYFYKKAIELSPTYFEKAELNLEALSDKKTNSGA